MVVKGCGGDAEPGPAQAVLARWHDGPGASEALLPTHPSGNGWGEANGQDGPEAEQDGLRATWRDRGPGTPTVLATITLGLLVLGHAPDTIDTDAIELWDRRHG